MIIQASTIKAQKKREKRKNEIVTGHDKILAYKTKIPKGFKKSNNAELFKQSSGFSLERK